jgi:hypothetical protein
MRTLLVALTLLAASFAVAAPAQADVCVKDHCVTWDCVQVYPWSRLCQGDVVGFLDAYLGEICDRSCLA